MLCVENLHLGEAKLNKINFSAVKPIKKPEAYDRDQGLFETIEVAQCHCNRHGIRTREDVGLVVGENIGQAIVETAL